MSTYILMLTLTQAGRKQMMDDPKSLLTAQSSVNEPQVQTLGLYGVLGDVSFQVPGLMRASYNPQLVAETCAACHQYNNDHDEDGDFETKLNRAMVNLYPMIECRDAEIAELRERIERHVGFTGSAKGQAILDDWKTKLEKFYKVMPADYERVLNAVERAKESGLEGEDAVLAAFEENAKVGN